MGGFSKTRPAASLTVRPMTSMTPMTRTATFRARGRAGRTTRRAAPARRVTNGRCARLRAVARAARPGRPRHDPRHRDVGEPPALRRGAQPARRGEERRAGHGSPGRTSRGRRRRAARRRAHAARVDGRDRVLDSRRARPLHGHPASRALRPRRRRRGALHPRAPRRGADRADALPAAFRPPAGMGAPPHGGGRDLRRRVRQRPHQGRRRTVRAAAARCGTGRARLSPRTGDGPRRARGPRLRVALSGRRRDGRRLVDHVTKPRSAPEPVLRFATAADLEAWLDANHDRNPGIWLEIAKKGSRDRSVTYAEAIEVALCFGWIDGQKRRGDDEHWLQRFTPRSTRSRWSKINRDKAEQLIAAGRMRPPGLTEVDRARTDGRWAAYEGQRGAAIPDDLAHELDRDPKA